MTVKEMKKWITLKYLPAIIPYKRQYMKLVFARENGVSDHLLFFADKDYFQENPEIAAMFEKVAHRIIIIARSRRTTSVVCSSFTSAPARRVSWTTSPSIPSPFPLSVWWAFLGVSPTGEERRERCVEVCLPAGPSRTRRCASTSNPISAGI